MRGFRLSRMFLRAAIRSSSHARHHQHRRQTQSKRTKAAPEKRRAVQKNTRTYQPYVPPQEPAQQYYQPPRPLNTGVQPPPYRPPQPYGNQPTTFYNQPTQAFQQPPSYQPGQFQQPPPYQPPPYSPRSYPPPGSGGPPQPTYYPPAPPLPPPAPPHRYRGWTLAIMLILYFAALIMAVIDAGVVDTATKGVSANSDTTSSTSGFGVVIFLGTFLLIALEIFIAFKDGRSFFTLFGKFQWRRMKVFPRICLGFVYLIGWIMTPTYIIMAIQHHLRTNGQTLGAALQSGWVGYRAKSATTQIGLALLSLLLIASFVLFTSFGAMVDRANALKLLTPTAPTGATSTPPVVAVDTSVATTDTSVPTSTSQPTPTPTAKPTPKPTQVVVKPTPKPTQPPPATLSLTFTCASAVDYSSGQVCVHTEPGAALTITVTYCSGYDATSGSLQGTVYANGSGNYIWYWTPETKCRGQATAYVSANWNGQSTSNSDRFTVQ